MGSADPRAGEHGNGRFRHHWHVQSHQISLANALGLQGIGRLANLGVQFAVGEFAHVTGLAFPDQRRLVRAIRFQVPVEAVVGNVGGATLEPTGERRIRPIENGVKRLKPLQLPTGCISPERIWILSSGFGQCRISIHATNSGGTGEVARWCENALLMKHAFNGGSFAAHRGCSSRDAGCD